MHHLLQINKSQICLIVGMENDCMKSNIRKIIIFLVFLFSVMPTAAFSNDDFAEYRITYNNREATVKCVRNENDILLLPLKDVAEIVGLEHTECGRCGNDEIYNKNTVNEKGYILVNWYKDVIT